MQKRNAYNLFTRREMLLDSGKALWTDDMLDTACIGGCSFRINTQTDQPGGIKIHVAHKSYLQSSVRIR